MTGMFGDCSDTKMPDGFGKLVGIFLVLATLLASLPQVIKLIKAKTSEGVAPVTLALITTFGGSNLASSLVVKWRQFQACKRSADCFFLILDVQQQLAAAVVFASLLIIVVSLPPHNTRLERSLAGFTVSFIAMLSVIAVILSAVAACGHAALGFSHAVSVLSAVCAFTAYVPQLIDTWRCGGAGSLSPLFLFIQVLGCLLVNYNQIIVNKDPAPVWLPTAVSGLMQLGVLCLIFYFRIRPRGECVDRLTSTPGLPLLDEQSDETATRLADASATAVAAAGQRPLTAVGIQ